MVSSLFGIRRFEMNRQRSKMKLLESELRATLMEAEARASKSESDRKTHELEEARKFQLAMLPEEIPQFDDLEIAVYMEAATEVGGDYYDLHVGENSSLAVAVGDATGHGLKAATMVSVIKGLFCADEYELDIEAFFRKAAHTIQHMRLKNLYMALTLMDIKDNHVRITSAGMPPAYLYRAGSGEIEKMVLKGVPLGALANSHYQIREFVLNPGDTLLLLSDGLPELFNPGDEMFGYERVEKLFEETAGLSSQEIVDRLVQAGKKWLEGRPQEDDITFLVIKNRQGA
jgi:serine phosphatase RsbU (regulator of sigma subunit)